MSSDDLITPGQNIVTAPGDRSRPCALALAVLGRGRSDDTGETRSDYAGKCAAAERTLIEAEDDDVIGAVRTMSTGDTVKLVGRAIRRLASRIVVTAEMARPPSGSA